MPPENLKPVSPKPKTGGYLKTEGRLVETGIQNFNCINAVFL
jgi:hypothetical protein